MEQRKDNTKQRTMHRTAGILKVNDYVYLPSDNDAWDFMSKFLKTNSMEH